MAKLETRNAFVQTHHTIFLGTRLGVELKVPVRCGIGYYWMLSNIHSKLYNPLEYGRSDQRVQPKMHYVAGYVDYRFYKEDDWELTVPIQLGFGETYYLAKGQNRFANGLVVPLEAGVDVSYLFSEWVGFGVGLGTA